MRSLFQNRPRRALHGRRRSSHGSSVTSLEKLEPRLALAGDVSRPLLEATTRLYMDPSMHGPHPVVMGKSQVVGHDVKSFVISRVPEGSVVEKLDTATNTWVDVSTKPTSSNPRELLQLLKNRLIQQGDSLRWTPKAGTASSVQQAFEMIGWDDGSELLGVSEGAPSEVQNLSAGGTEGSGILFSWNSPEPEEDLTYSVTTSYAGLDGETQTIRTLTKSTSFEQPLENIATTYSLTVAASSDVGTSSPESVSYNPATAMPSEPLSLMVAPGADDSVTLSWQPPLYAGPPGASIASYEATNWQSGETQNVLASSTSVVFTGIEPRDASLFTVRAYNDDPNAGAGLLAQIAVDQTGQQLPLPPSNPFMGVEGLSTMHANAASSDVTLFPGPGAESAQLSPFKYLGAAMPSILMTENGALVCVGVETGDLDAKTPVVMLISPTTLEVLDKQPLIKPVNAEGDLAGGVYNFIDYQNRLVLVDASGYMRWYANDYDPQTDTGTLSLVGYKNLNMVGPNLDLVVGLVPDYEGRIWFATEGSIDEDSPAKIDKNVVQPAVGYYDPQSGRIEAIFVPTLPGTIPAMIANSISSSPAGVAVATTQELYLFRAEDDGSITTVWQNQYQNSNYRKPGQLSPGTGSTPVFFGPSTGYEYLVITDNATMSGNNVMPAENILVYRVSDGSLVSEEPFLNPEAYNAGTENAPIAFGNRIIIPSTYGYWYPPPSETTTSVPKYATFVGGIQSMTIDSGGAQTLAWTSTVPSSALPRLSLADNNVYTVQAEYATDRNKTTATYSFSVIDSETGVTLSDSPYIGQNHWTGKTPSDIDKDAYALNTLQMTGVISPSGVFYQGTAEGIFMVSSIPTSAPQNLTATPTNLNDLIVSWSAPEEVSGGSTTVVTYEVTLTQNGVDFTPITTTDLSANFVGLLLGNPYTVTVLPKTQYGDGTPASLTQVYPV